MSRQFARCIIVLFLVSQSRFVVGERMPGNFKAGSHTSILLVEDEVMIRMMVADMLEELGYKIAGEAGDMDEGVRLVQSVDFDIAILDVNVNGKVITPVAEAVQLRGRPFVFATGYGAQGLPEKFRDRATIQKPFQIETLARTIETVLKGIAA